MELPTQEVPGHDIAIPLSSTYGGHMMHHHHDNRDPIPEPHNHSIIPSATNGSSMAPSLENDQNAPAGFTSKKVGPAVRYRECLKNHAAAMGGNATDGCGEFMPSGEEGSIEALTCSACNCHRNFHRKEAEGEQQCDNHISQYCFNSHRVGRKLFLGYPTSTGTLIHSRPAAAAPVLPQQMIMSYNMAGSGHSLPSESDEQDEGFGGGGMVVARPPHHHQMVKKRFRTKFTPEQKEKMLSFAEKVGWKIQKQEESFVQQVCQEIGVKRRVLKVWMHNNKHHLARKNNLINNNNNPTGQLLVSANNNINSSTTN